MILDDDLRQKALAISREQLKELRRKYPDIGGVENREGSAKTSATQMDAPIPSAPIEGQVAKNSTH